MITNSTSGTNLHEVAPGIYRINTPVQIPNMEGATSGPEIGRAHV